MNIKEAKQEAINAIKTYFLKDEKGNYLIPIDRQRPIVFMGPAGIGKTDIAKQIADELDIGFVSYSITHHTRQSAIGLPKIINKTYEQRSTVVTEYSMSEIIFSVYDYMENEQKTEGILFIDEFNCASETLTATMLQFLQNKTFGTHQVPTGWKIILAGNPPEYNKSVRELDLVTMDRLRIISIAADFESWKEYALSKNIHISILSYLSQKQGNLCRFSNDKNGRQLVTPRGWEELSQTMTVYNKLNLDISLNLVSQFINYPRIANEFMNFYELFNKVLSQQEIEAILNGKTTDSLRQRLKQTSFDIHCSVIWILTGHLQTAAKSFLSINTVCDELYTLLIKMKKEGSFCSLYNENTNSAGYLVLDKLLTRLPTSSFETAFQKIEDEFQGLIKNRTTAIRTADIYTTNILNFIADTFGCNGEMEIFLNNINIDSDIIKMLIETQNQTYIAYNLEFKEKYKQSNIDNRLKRIS